MLGAGQTTPLTISYHSRGSAPVGAGSDVREMTAAEHRDAVLGSLTRAPVDGAVTRGAALDAWYWAQCRPEALDERLAVASEALLLAADLEDADLAMRARRARLHDYLEQGDAASARRELATLCRAHADQDVAPPSVLWLEAMWALMEGRFAVAEGQASAALEATRSGASCVVGHQHAAQLFALRREQGRLGEIETVVRERMAQHARAPAWRAAVASVVAHVGRTSDARAELDRLVGPSGLRAPVDAAWLPAAVLVAEVCHRLDWRDGAGGLFTQLAPWSGRHVVVAPAAVYLGPVDHYLGLLATTASRFEDADAHLGAAVDQARRLGARPSLARSQVALAALALRRDGPGDAARATNLLAEARLAAGELGMGELSREARLLAAVARYRPAAGTGGAVPGGQRAERESFVVRCFGSFELWVEGEPLHLRTLKPKARSALRLLALHAGRPVHREVIMEALWRDSAPAAATRSLQVVVSSLRQTLEPGVARGASSLLVREGEAYRLAVPVHGDCDVLRFDRAMEEARSARGRGDALAARRRLEAALDAYTGDLLPMEGPAEWVVDERERYRAAAVDAAHGLAELLLERGEHAPAAAACERGLRIDRYRDDVWRLLIRALEDAGNHMAARRAKRDYDEMLVELGLA